MERRDFGDKSAYSADSPINENWPSRFAAEPVCTSNCGLTYADDRLISGLHPAATSESPIAQEVPGEVTLELRDDEAGQSRAVASLFHLGKEFLQITADRLMKQSQVGLAAAIC